MDEPRFERNHRWNILNPDYTRVGVGIAIARGYDGILDITEDFAASLNPIFQKSDLAL